MMTAKLSISMVYAVHVFAISTVNGSALITAGAPRGRLFHPAPHTVTLKAAPAAAKAAIWRSA
jgi:hypothetical protein